MIPKSVTEVQYIAVSKASKFIPGRPHKNTVIRWCDRGFEGVILQSWRCGNRRFTTVPAIDAFIAATTGIQSPKPAVTSSAHQLAESQLDAMGIV